MKQLLLLLILLNPSVTRAQQGMASWYGEEHRGRMMANGQAFDPDKLTAASWDYPLGTLLRVAHKQANVVVVVTDRGPSRRLAREGRVIDLSAAAFRKLAAPELGLVRVTIEKIDSHSTSVATGNAKSSP